MESLQDSKSLLENIVYYNTIPDGIERQKYKGLEKKEIVEKYVRHVITNLRQEG